MEKAYETPTITTIGTLRELTEQIDKCGGTGDEFLPQLLSPVFAEECP